MEWNFGKIEELIQQSLGEYNVPSLSLCVLKNQNVIYEGFFGYKDAEKQLAPNKDTRYACASVTKAMTATALGILKDEGKIDWNTPVIEYLPDFRMYDEYATLHVTLKDMLSHNTGLPRHDLCWYSPEGKCRTTPELVHAIRYFKPNKGFRTRYEYNNLMFTTAGYIVEKVSGMPWGEFLTQRIFKPLGMNDTTYQIDGLRSAQNRALPYTLRDGKAVLTEYLNFDGMAGCGTVNSTIHDMAKWVALNLGGGQYQGKRIISEDVLREIHTHYNAQPPVLKDPMPEMPVSSYGFGWAVTPFRGRHCLNHSGGIDGFSSYLTFMPLDGYGIMLFANVEGTQLHFAVAAAIYDLLLGVQEEKDWPKAYRERVAQVDALAAGADQKIRDTVNPAAKPTLANEAYVGAYLHRGYGKLEVVQKKGSLCILYNGIEFAMEHNNHDTYHVERDGGLALATFRLNSSGTVARLEWEVEPALGEPVPFDRV